MNSNGVRRDARIECRDFELGRFAMKVVLDRSKLLGFDANHQLQAKVGKKPSVCR